MPCYNPLTGYRSRDLNPSGKRSIVFNPGPSSAFSGVPLKLPCGQCIGCRLERSRQWAIRCVHEASLYDENSFITLTYNDRHLPKDGSLVVSHFQNFMKRLRFTFPHRVIRFFHCGEYGETFGRPHYHACIFNFDFLDKELWKEHNGQKYYVSKTLERLWPFGFSTVGEVTFESAAYVARYITKKITGDGAEAHYGGRKPEYVTMSRRPGIGKAWLEKFKSDVFPDDFVIIRGRKMKPPKFYKSSLLEHELEQRRLEVHRESVKRAADSSVDRLKVREEIQHQRFLRLKRSLDNEI